MIFVVCIVAFLRLSRFKMESSNTTNLSSVNMVLDELTRGHLNVAIPVLCFIGLMMLVGACGNALVIVTYFRRIDTSSTNLFIFFLAVFDIMNCIIGLPLEIYNLTNPYMNDLDGLCKAHKFISFTADLSSGLIIVCISFDRYLRIASPHKGLTVKHSKMLVLVLCVITALISSLTIPVYGKTEITFYEHPGIVGYGCGVTDARRQTVLPLLFNILILLCFTVGVVILLTVYILLGLKVKRWNQGRKIKMSRGKRLSDHCQPTAISEETGSPDSPDHQPSETFTFLQPTTEKQCDSKDTTDEPSFKRPGFLRELSRSLDRNHFLKLDLGFHTSGTQTLPHRKAGTRKPGGGVTRKHSIPNLNELRKRMKISRTTVMFISATIAFVASHIPYACVKLAFTINPALIDHMSPVGQSFFLFAEFSFIVSYAVNPIIYSFMNPKYRRECRSILRDLSGSLKCHSKKFFIG